MNSTTSSAASPQALAVLYELNRRIAASRDLRKASDGVLSLLSSRLDMQRGTIAQAVASDEAFRIISATGMQREDFGRRCGKSGTKLRRSLVSGTRGVVMLRNGEFVEVDPYDDSCNRTARGEITFFCAPVPAGRAGETAFLAVDRLFAGDIAPAEDLRLLQAAASLLSPLFAAASPRAAASAVNVEASPLGRILRHQITAWMEPMQPSRRLRSDLLERLMETVERIVVSAALEKTGGVQTEAARFLGINRNTLASKIRKYGLGRKKKK